MSQKFCCPQCGNKDLQAIVENNINSQTTGGGYSGGKGCLGFLLFGPLGLLCGNCGGKPTTTVSTQSVTYWMCSKCGHKFRSPEDLKKSLNEEQPRKTFSAILIIGGIISFIMFCMSAGADAGIAFIIALFEFGLFALAGYGLYRFEENRNEKLKSQIEKLERDMERFSENENE